MDERIQSEETSSRTLSFSPQILHNVFLEHFLPPSSYPIPTTFDLFPHKSEEVSLRDLMFGVEPP